MFNSQYPTTLASNLSQYYNLATSSSISLNKGKCRLWKCFMQRQTIGFLSGVSCYRDLEINHRLKQPLHRCSFIFKKITSEKITRFENTVNERFQKCSLRPPPSCFICQQQQ